MADGLRVINLVSGLESAHGGPTYAVPRLNEWLGHAGVQSEVFADMPPGEIASPAREGIRLFPRDYAGVPGLRKLHFSRKLARALFNDRLEVDLIHAHGLWRMQNLYAASAARRKGVPLVVSTRGMLSDAALSISRGSKLVFGVLAQTSALSDTRCFHATSDAERDEIRAFGLSQPVAVIPNGIDLPEAVDVMSRPPGAERYVLSLGRIHPKKALDRLIQAWALIEPDFPAHHLKIVGPVEGRYDEVLRALIQELRLQRVRIVPPVSGAEKDAMLRDADVFAISSLNENFGNTISESLASGVPVISTKGAPWSGLEENGCGWWVDHGPEPMAAALRVALALPDEARFAMGARGRAWMERDFTWRSVGEQMAELYRWLVGGGQKPSFVHVERGSAD